MTTVDAGIQHAHGGRIFGWRLNPGQEVIRPQLLLRWRLLNEELGSHCRVPKFAYEIEHRGRGREHSA
jgi:hypothetical protein